MKKKIRLYTILLSLLLHILFFLATDSVIKLKLLGITPVNPVKNSTPIVFDLDESKKPKTVIESPEGKQEKVKKAKYLSDKSLNARDNSGKDDLPLNKPFSKGEIDAPLISGIKSKKNINRKKPEHSGETEFKKEDSTLRKETETNEKKELKGLYNFNVNEELLSKNIESKVKKQGGFSFSTYNWDFAPYMLYMKRKIQSNIYPPMAFKTLGLIDGETLVKFTIQRDGSLTDVRLLDYKGHKSLMETSLQAIRISAPFKKLPEDFPDPYLVVTGKFIYFVRR